MTDKWIQSATSKGKGAFSAKAKKAGMSTSAYAKKVLRKGNRTSFKTKKQANLAQTLSKLRPSGKRGRTKT